MATSAKKNGFLIGLMAFLLFSTLAHGQEVAQQALSIFPPDTRQVAYVDLAQLRTLPNYRQLRGLLLNRQMAAFEQFLRSMGVDPEKDVSAAIVGWRGDPAKGSLMFGLAAGNFNPVEAQSFIAQENLPRVEYQGFTLDAFGAGHSSQDLFFTFLNGGLAAFGGLADLKTLVDAYQGRHPALGSNQDFVKWENALDGSSPEWGVTTGKAALDAAAPWLPSAQLSQFERVIGPVKAVLYQANWQGSFSTEISIVCENAGSARTLAELLSIWRDSASLTGRRPADINGFIQGLDINASGDKVTLDGQGPPSTAAQLLRGALAR